MCVLLYCIAQCEHLPHNADQLTDIGCDIKRRGSKFIQYPLRYTHDELSTEVYETEGILAMICRLTSMSANAVSLFGNWEGRSKGIIVFETAVTESEHEVIW